MILITQTDYNIWDKHWRCVPHTPLLQSWEYGEAKRRSQGVRPERFLIRRSEDISPVGLMQAIVRSLPLVGGAARINRGPVFIDESFRPVPSPDDMEAVFHAIKVMAEKRRWRLVKIAPELPPDDEIISCLQGLGFVKQDNLSGAASAVIDIARTPEEIRAGFHGKWRNLLNKSEKMGLELELPPAKDALSFLIDEYEKMQQEKNFKGIPSQLLHEMASQKGPTWTCNILFTRYEGKRHGAVMTVGHGDTCTYLIGWTSYEGRRLQSNYFLLWHSMLMMREMGYRYFDLGGLGSNTTEGVEHFKKRLKGQEYSLAGEFSYSNLPFLK